MSGGIRWTEVQYHDWLRFREAAGEANLAVRTADVEPDPKHAAKAPDVRQEVHPHYRINVHSKRRRLADPDGVSAKAAIDGLVCGGLLPDDSAAWIEAVTFSQEKAEIDETVIEVWEVSA